MIDKWTFGLTMLITGMGGTLLTLVFFSLIIYILKIVLPHKKEEEVKSEE